MSGNTFTFVPADLDRWLLLPLTGDVDHEAAALVFDRVGHAASEDFLEMTTAWVAGTTRIARRDADRLLSGSHVPTFAAWVLLPGPRLLLPGPVAFLRAGPLAADATDDDALGAVVDLSAELHGELEVEGVDTASGPALLVRRRPVRDLDGVRAVEEHRLAIWPRPDLEAVVSLTLYVVDLVEGGAAAEPFRELATGLRWDVT